MKFTLITGASQGIGRSFAHECAQRGDNLVLVSLPDENLDLLAAELSATYPITTDYHETDLLQSGAVEELFDWCQRHHYAIDKLINNAGIGLQNSFSDGSLGAYQQLMRLNMETMVNLTFTFLPMLKKQPRSYLLNLGSIASYMHVPYKAVYSGSKNFVLAFSNALRHELKPHRVSVTCLCPGPTITNEKVAARVNSQGWKGKLLTLKASTVAKKGVDGMLNGKREVIPGLANRTVVQVARWLPTNWSIAITGKIFSNSPDIEAEKTDHHFHQEEAQPTKIAH